jgi:hypothetical protein
VSTRVPDHQAQLDALAAAHCREIVVETASTRDAHGGRPAAVNDDLLAIARARRDQGESVTAIARHVRVGRSTL